MDGANDNNLMKLVPNLNQASDYIHCKRLMYAYLRRDDPMLIGLSSKPRLVPTANRRPSWRIQKNPRET